MSWRDSNERLNLAKQKLAASERAAALNAQVKRELIVSNFQRAQTQAAVAKAYHDSMIGLANNRLDIEKKKLDVTTQTQTKVISDTVGYANAVASGTPPLQARAQFPLAKLLAAEEKGQTETITRRTDVPDAAAVLPTPAQSASPGYLGGWLFGLGKHPAIPATPGSPATLKGQLTESVKVPVGTSPASAFRAAQSPAGGTAATPAKQFTDKSGTVYNYTGTSDDPTSDKDPSHWQLVAH